MAYALSDCAFIYPITPSSPMGEMVDEWSAQGMAFSTEIASFIGRETHIKNIYHIGRVSIDACSFMG